MSDTNTRFLIPELSVRGQVVKLSRSYQSILVNAPYPPAVARMLGEALAAVGALGSIIKLRGSIILQAQGDGPLHTLVAQANNAGEIRGLAHGYENIGAYASFNDLLGKGRLVLTIDAEHGRRYQGIIALEDDSLSEVLKTYFAQSEQLKTHLLLAANDRQAACFLLQQLPGEGREGPELAENHWQHAQILAATLTDEELLELPTEQILHRLYHEHDVQLFVPHKLVFHCRCAREKVIPAIMQMGYAEAMQLVEEQGEISANCEFCNQLYRFDRVDVATLFKASGKAPSQPQ